MKWKRFCKDKYENNPNFKSEKGTIGKEMRSRKISLKRNKHFMYERVDGVDCWNGRRRSHRHFPF